MNSPAVSPTRQARPGRGRPVKQFESHNGLLRDVSSAPQRWRRGRPDAIIVPATRPASALANLVDRASEIGTRLVVLCSKQANVDQIHSRIRTAGGRGIVVGLGEGYVLPTPRLETLSDKFAKVNRERLSDLSRKRNFGLMLARLCGWSKIVFVDDDITVSSQDLSRLVHQLDNYQIAGMACQHYPDNSVVCHARRLAGLGQDVFVTGAVLGINCVDQPLPFFPDIYNEDWFFFGDAVARRQLAKVGVARQARYNPYAMPMRAEHEEFGDLLAEGLYSLIEWRGGHSFRQITHRANKSYWEHFIEARRRQIAHTKSALDNLVGDKNCSDDVPDAIKSLDAAEGRYQNDAIVGTITSDRCLEFLEDWRSDTDIWRRFCQGIDARATVADALAELNVDAANCMIVD